MGMIKDIGIDKETKRTRDICSDMKNLDLRCNPTFYNLLEASLNR